MAHLYNEETISQAIDTKWAGKTVHFAKETDSTSLREEDVLTEDGKRRRAALL